MEHPVRLWRTAFLRPCLVLWRRCLHRDADAGVLGTDAVDRHSAGHAGRRPCGGADRHANLPPARPLFRAGDAGISAGDSLRAGIPGLPGNVAADAQRAPGALHPVQGPTLRHLPRGRPVGAGHDRRHAGGELALRPGVAGGAAERIGRRSRRYRRLALEDARTDRVRHDRRRGRGSLRLRPAGGHAGFRLRHVGISTSGGGDPVRWHCRDCGGQ